MFCTNCGTQFEGKFCTECGQAVANATQPPNASAQGSSTHQYYDNEGDLIDLAVIYGAYKTRKNIIAFFQRCTSYSIEEIGRIADYIESDITPCEYSAVKALMMRDQIEAPFKEAAAKARLKESWNRFINEPQAAAQTKGQRIRENKRNGVACCPKCGSTSISANKKGFGIGKAVIGASAVGPLGLMAGNINAKKLWVTCLNCGHRWKV